MAGRYMAFLFWALLVASPAAQATSTTAGQEEGSAVYTAMTTAAADGGEDGSVLPLLAMTTEASEDSSESDGEPDYERIANCEDHWRRCARHCRRLPTDAAIQQCRDNCGSKYIACTSVE